MKFPDLPPVWTAGLAIAAWALAGWAPLVRIDPPGWAGAAVMTAGVALILWSGLWFLRRETPIEPGRRPKALVTEGPYRLNRNPIYTGMVVGLVGWALWLGALSALAPALAAPVIFTRRFILWEEAALREAFGEEAEAWLARTRRW